MEKVASRIEKWISQKIEEAEADGAVVGLSGGLDSSVTAVLAKRALGGNILGLVMPCESNGDDKKKALMIAEKFRIKTEEIDISDVFDKLRKLLPESDEKTLGNVKARLRMTVLYNYANNNKCIVLGTSNKSELMVGYFTKHGDSAADIEPIGDLYKTQVVELAKHLEIPEEIIEAKPSAGLWEGQVDENELGMSYEILDKILMGIEKNTDLKDTDSEKIAKVGKMIRNSEHKRKMPDVCVIS